MSRSPNDEQDHRRDLPEAFASLTSMLRGGRSFSGRERNCCFLNTLGHPPAENRFADVSAGSGLDFQDDGRAVAPVDWDLDGRMDLWISNRNAPRLRFMRNQTSSGGHYLALKLVGDASQTSRDAIGARVTVVSRASPDGQPPARWIRTLRAGEGFLAQGSKWLHLGLGDVTEIEKVLVRWPTQSAADQLETYTGLSADRRYILEQHSGRAREAPDARVPAIKASPQPPQPPAPAVRIPLTIRVPAPLADYESFDGTAEPLTTSDNQWLLVNLFSATCRPCLAELQDLVNAQPRLQQQGIRVVALSVDALLQGEGPPTDEAAQAFLQRLDFPYGSGRATEALLAEFQQRLGVLLPLQTTLPLPTSYLIDPAQRLAVVYHGRVAAEQLLADAKDQPPTARERLAMAAALPGTALAHPVVERRHRAVEATIRFQLARDLWSRGHLAAAAAEYREVTGLEAASAQAHNNLGMLLRQLNQSEEARRHYEAALKIQPKMHEAHNNLGVLLLKTGDQRGAVLHWQLALESREDYVEPHMNLATFYEQRGRLPEAAAHYRSVTTMQPDHVDALINLGVVLFKQGELGQAKMQFQSALAVDEDLVEAHNNLGVVCEDEGQLAEALRHFRRALEIEPDYAAARRNAERIRNKIAAGS